MTGAAAANLTVTAVNSPATGRGFTVKIVVKVDEAAKFPAGDCVAEIVAVPTPTTVITPAVIVATAGLEDIHAHAPIELELGEVNVIGESPTPASRAESVPTVGLVPATVMFSVAVASNQFQSLACLPVIIT